jgi:GNAT superfamily N-acetyltransferase
LEAYLRTAGGGQWRGSAGITAPVRRTRDEENNGMASEETIRMVQGHQYETEETRALYDAINRYNMERTGRTEFFPVVFLLRDEADAVRGGVVGHIWGDWMHLAILWVDEGLRGRGYGTRLLEAAEAYARERGCHAVYLETASFQAPDFYPRFGYEEFALLEAYPPGHRKHFYRKTLRVEDQEGDRISGAQETNQG